jgi:DNA-binding response OmpR family regulator
MAKQGTILVVDDDTELREGLTAMLGQRGYRTLSADDGREASRLIDEHRPDLVILDMMMPHSGGLAVLEQFSGKPHAPRFIMITANDGVKHRRDAQQLGVVDYIKKPFTMDRLLEGVGKHVAAPAGAPRTEETPMTIRCRCPNCGSRIKAPIQMRGQMRTCPGCKQQFVITFQPPEDEGPKLVLDERRAPVARAR